MSDQLLSLVSVLIGVVSLFLQIKGSPARRSKRIRYRLLKFGRLKRERLDVTDDEV